MFTTFTPPPMGFAPFTDSSGYGRSTAGVPLNWSAHRPSEEADMADLIASSWPFVIGYAMAVGLYVILRDIAAEVRGE
ncbi:hypothetical protein GCM10009745_47980 [Kribbella yunnanensis]|uniref:Uncharacterized protein n=1 Tax=Kribbella yunnanensis TaxID=190194 RepID=A0ABP4TZD7_9ACTN